MSTPEARTIPSAVWTDLISHAWEESEGSLAERLLGIWRQRWGCRGAALYSRRDGHHRLEVSDRGAPSERFPDGFDDPPDAPSSEDGPHLIELPGGLLAYYGDPRVAAGSSSEGLTLLLASALRNHQLRKQLKHQSFQVNYRGVELEALYDVGLAIAATLDLDVLSEEILLRAVSLLDARRGALYLREKEGFHLHQTFGGDARQTFQPIADDDGRRKLRVPDDLLPGAEHLLALPIEIHGDPRGALVVADKESRTGVGPFSDRDRRTLMLFANQAAIALENARLHRQELEKQRLEREMELAAEIQREILPKGEPQVPGWELVGWSRPARQVGGDYYDLLPLDDGRLRLTVGDVSGKGIPAALLVSTLHSSLRLLLGDTPVNGGLLARLNQHVHESSAANKFITLLVVEADTSDGPDQGCVRWVNAGHNPGLLVRRDGSVEELSAGGLPVGILADARYQGEETRLASGDLLCLYSDGITEAAAPDGEEFGTERLVDLLQQHRTEPLEALRATLDRAVSDFARGEPQADDETLVLLRRS